jgi:hypothetical protein
MADPPNRLTQQPLMPSPASSNHWRARWITLATWTGILALFYLLGPVIFLGRDTQRETGGRVWHAEERWAHVSGSAILSLLWYVPVLVFHTALAGFWIALFGGLAAFLHLPFLRGLGGTIFWLPIPSSMLLRWVLALPLTSWIALLLEHIQPHTTWEAKRVVSPDEQVQLAAAQAAEEKKRQAALSRRSSQAQLTASKKPVSTKRSRPTHAAQTSQPTTRDARHTGSLWDQVDWSQVPDDHPLKQAAFEEAERQAAERHNAERTRSVLSQMANQQKATTPPRSAATNESVAPPETPAYNWDEGEGTVTDS